MRPTSALAFILGRVVARTAPLTFTRGSGGGRNNRAIHTPDGARKPQSSTVLVLLNSSQGWSAPPGGVDPELRLPSSPASR